MTLLRALGEAIRFLTILPTPGLSHTNQPIGATAIGLFPAVGLLIGGIGVAVGWLAEWLWGSPMHAIATVLTWVLITAGLHLDGVADTCDGLFSWRARDRKLEIMRDSRIGTMGALGLMTILPLKAGALIALGTEWWVAALVAPVWGRWANVYGIFWFPVARDEGLATTTKTGLRSTHFALATGVAVVATLAVDNPLGGLVAVAIWPIVHLIAGWMVRSLGGLTGDTYGALCELAETGVLLSLAAWHRHPSFAATIGKLAAWVGVG